MNVLWQISYKSQYSLLRYNKCTVPVSLNDAHNFGVANDAQCNNIIRACNSLRITRLTCLRSFKISLRSVARGLFSMHPKSSGALSIRHKYADPWPRHGAGACTVPTLVTSSYQGGFFSEGGAFSCTFSTTPSRPIPQSSAEGRQLSPFSRVLL